MVSRPTSNIIQRLCNSLRPINQVDLTDAQLLDSFIARRDEAAFAALLRRHGPMVWGVCRRVLGHHHDAEDAFQAAFLVLAKKAASVVPRERLAGWLHGVAYHTARKARTLAGRRRRREKLLAEMPEPCVADNDSWNDLGPFLDRELHGLPDRYRAALILCDLQGRTRTEAARQLGVPEGTLSARLTRGRRLLAGRLTRRGLTLSAGALTAMLTGDLAAPAAVLSATIKVATGPMASGAMTTPAGTLTQGVLYAMLLKKLKIASALVCLLALVGYGVGVLLSAALAGPLAQNGPAATDGALPPQAETKQPPPNDKKTPVWTLTFRFKNPRLIWVLGQGQVQKPIWYCCYEVTNPTDQPHTFIPDFELVTGDKHYHDAVFPDAEAKVRQAEDPTGFLNLKNSVAIADTPIPPTQPNVGAAPKGVWGVALWTDVDPDAKNFTLFVSGLSNAWSADGAVIKRKVLKINLVRDGNELRPTGPGEWVYLPGTAIQQDIKAKESGTAITAQAQYGAWSKVDSGLQGRLVLEKVSSPGLADILKISVEWKNVSGNQIRVYNVGAQWTWQLLDAAGKPVPEAGLPRSGPPFVPKYVAVAPGTYAGFSLYDSGVGVPQKGTLLPVGSHDWLLQPGTYTLRASYSSPPHKDTPLEAWPGGTLEFPPLKIVVK
jgi:RNA polymerase sigma factor (sigma-70 family)